MLDDDCAKLARYLTRLEILQWRADPSAVHPPLPYLSTCEGVPFLLEYFFRASGIKAVPEFVPAEDLRQKALIDIAKRQDLTLTDLWDIWLEPEETWRDLDSHRTQDAELCAALLEKMNALHNNPTSVMEKARSRNQEFLHDLVTRTQAICDFDPTSYSVIRPAIQEANVLTVMDYMHGRCEAWQAVERLGLADLEWDQLSCYAALVSTAIRAFDLIARLQRFRASGGVAAEPLPTTAWADYKIPAILANIGSLGALVRYALDSKLHDDLPREFSRGKLRLSYSAELLFLAAGALNITTEQLQSFADRVCPSPLPLANLAKIANLCETPVERSQIARWIDGYLQSRVDCAPQEFREDLRRFLGTCREQRLSLREVQSLWWTTREEWAEIAKMASIDNATVETILGQMKANHKDRISWAERTVKDEGLDVAAILRWIQTRAVQYGHQAPGEKDFPVLLRGWTGELDYLEVAEALHWDDSISGLANSAFHECGARSSQFRLIAVKKLLQDKSFTESGDFLAALETRDGFVKLARLSFRDQTNEMVTEEAQVSLGLPPGPAGRDWLLYYLQLLIDAMSRSGFTISDMEALSARREQVLKIERRREIAKACSHDEETVPGLLNDLCESLHIKRAVFPAMDGILRPKLELMVLASHKAHLTLRDLYLIWSENRKSWADLFAESVDANLFKELCGRLRAAHADGRKVLKPIFQKHRTLLSSLFKEARAEHTRLRKTGGAGKGQTTPFDLELFRALEEAADLKDRVAGRDAERIAYCRKLLEKPLSEWRLVRDDVWRLREIVRREWLSNQVETCFLSKFCLTAETATALCCYHIASCDLDPAISDLLAVRLLGLQHVPGAEILVYYYNELLSSVLSEDPDFRTPLLQAAQHWLHAARLQWLSIDTVEGMATAGAEYREIFNQISSTMNYDLTADELWVLHSICFYRGYAETAMALGLDGDTVVSMFDGAFEKAANHCGYGMAQINAIYRHNQWPHWGHTKAHP